jgi:hypothetical protein
MKHASVRYGTNRYWAEFIGSGKLSMMVPNHLAMDAAQCRGSDFMHEIEQNTLDEKEGPAGVGCGNHLGGRSIGIAAL